MLMAMLPLHLAIMQELKCGIKVKLTLKVGTLGAMEKFLHILPLDLIQELLRFSMVIKCSKINI